MDFANTQIELAQTLDSQDQLAPFRDEFVIADPDLIYLDGKLAGTTAQTHRPVDAGCHR